VKPGVKDRTANIHVANVLKKHLKTAADIQRMARALNVHETTIYNWRSGSRHLKAPTVVSVSRYLDITTDELIGLTPDPVDTESLSHYLQDLLAVTNRLQSDAALFQRINKKARMLVGPTIP
jgi:plasmid maintenance system antidote protein VapI